MLKIDIVELYRVRMPLIYPFRTAYGSDDAIESVLVRLASGDVSGWGEASPLRAPTYSPEWAAGVFMALRDLLAPAVLGQAFATGRDLQRTLSVFRGNTFAKGGLDTAWWDLWARSRGEPLWKTLGGRGNVVEVGADFGIMDGIDALLAKVDSAFREGYRRVKLKYAPGWDLEMIAVVRSAFPDGVFHIDCNSAYTLDDRPMFRQLDTYRLAMIEQPLAHDDLIEHATLQKEIQTPICLDESITSPAKARKAIEIGACRWINLKPGRVGGLTPALEILRLCEQAGVPCWVGGMLESAVGQSHSLALATLPNIAYPCDIFPSARFYERDLSVPEIVLSGPSQITASLDPGIGCQPNPRRLRELTVESAALRA